MARSFPSRSRRQGVMPAKRIPLVLLAEDNPGDVYLVRSALSNAQLDVELTVKQDGEELLAFLEAAEAGEASCPDVVLLDLNLPRYGGALLLEKLRQSRRCAHLPIVVVTSSDSPGDRDLASRFGANAYFTKPTDYDEFMRIGSIVRALLEQESPAPASE